MHVEQRQALYEQLKRKLGSDAVSIEESDRMTRARDWWGGYAVEDHYLPDIVVKPTSTNAVVEVMHLADEHRVAVVPRGGGSGMAGAAAPVHGGILLDMKAMNRVLEVDEESLTARVQPGITVSELNAALANKGLWWPHDPDSDELATVGGCISLNGLGSFGSKYLHAPRMALAAEAVLPGGQIVKLGSKVRNSASGYRLLDLFLTAEGTLGVITEVTLRVYKLPARRAVDAIIFPKVADVIIVATELADSGLVPELLMLEDAAKFKGLASAENHAAELDELLAYGDGVLITIYAGDPIVVDFCRSFTHDLSSKRGGRRIEHQGILDRWWKSKHETPNAESNEDLAGVPGKRIAFCDLGVPKDKIEDLWVAHQRIAKEKGLESFGLRSYFCLPGLDTTVVLGVMFDAATQVTACRQWTAEISKLACDLAGTSTTTMGIGLRLHEVAPYEHGPSLNLMRNLKKVLDPQGILNPGKIPFQ
jgi:FAD/FMN-containing dehydrogenase